jgi:hypothetical protein
VGAFVLEAIAATFMEAERRWSGVGPHVTARLASYSSTGAYYS